MIYYLIVCATDGWENSIIAKLDILFVRILVNENKNKGNSEHEF